MTDDEAPAAPEPSPEASPEPAAVRSGGQGSAAPGGPALAGPTAHGAVPRESAVPVGRVVPGESAEALDRLRRAGIPAFLRSDRVRPATVYVDQPDAYDARIVLATLGAAVQFGDPLPGDPLPGDPLPGDPLPGDPLPDAAVPDAAMTDAAGTETGSDGSPLTEDAIDERFSALIGQLEQTEASEDGDGALLNPADGQDAAERVSARLGETEVPPELREEHFERPMPPPMPRPSRAGAVAIAVVLLGVAILAFGRLLGLNADESLTVGVSVTLVGALLLGRRLKQYRDDSDDGAVL